MTFNDSILVVIFLGSYMNSYIHAECMLPNILFRKQSLIKLLVKFITITIAYAYIKF